MAHQEVFEPELADNAFGIKLPAGTAKLLDFTRETARQVFLEAARKILNNFPMLSEETLRFFKLPDEVLGNIIFLPTSKGQVSPAFQFDFDNRGVHPIVPEVNAILLDAFDNDPWGVTSWWLDPNWWVKDQKSPSSLLGTIEESQLLKLASDTAFAYE